MEYQEQIDGIIARGKKIGLSVRQICLLAGIPEQNISRWRNNVSGPQFRSLARFVNGANEVLDRKEKQMLEHLESLHRPAQTEHGHGEAE
jgi:transcriptional regulator with XRE-family HTH domain